MRLESSPPSPDQRHVGLFHVIVDRNKVNQKTQGEIAEVPKTKDGIIAHADELTPFALEMLLSFVENRK